MPLSKDFLKLEKRIEENYLGRPVPTRFKKMYGKKYNKKDIRSLTYAIAKARGIRIERYSNSGKGVKL
jgi:hypothetical protein